MIRILPLILISLLSKGISQGLNLTLEGRFEAEVTIPSESPGGLEFVFSGMEFNSNIDTLVFTFRPHSMIEQDSFRIALGTLITNFNESLLDTILTNASEYSIYIDSTGWINAITHSPPIIVDIPDLDNPENLYVSYILRNVSWSNLSRKLLHLRSSIPSGLAEWTPLRVGNIWQYSISELNDSIETISTNRFHVKNSFPSGSGLLAFEIEVDQWVEGELYLTQMDTIVRDSALSIIEYIGVSPTLAIGGGLLMPPLIVGSPSGEDDLEVACYSYMYQSNNEILFRHDFGAVRISSLPFGTTRNAAFVGGYINGDNYGEFTPLSLRETDQNIPDDFNVVAFPNPFNSIVHIILPDLREDMELSLFDISGREIQNFIVPSHKKNLSIKFGVHDLTTEASGVYILRLSSGSYSVSRKLLFIK